MSEIMETPVAENAEEIKGEASICELDLQKIKEVIDNHFKTVEGLVRYNKSKDENVLILSKQIQVYRDGFAKIVLFSCLTKKLLIFFVKIAMIFIHQNFLFCVA